MLAVEEAENVLEKVERRCGTCAHVAVCAVFRAVSPMIERTFTDKTKPFDAEDIAKICSLYVSDVAFHFLNGK